MPLQRSPQRPAIRQIAFSPGGQQFATAASIPPVPDAVSTSTGFFVWKTYFKSSTTSPRIGPELGRAVEDDRLGQFQQRLFGNGRRAGGEQARLHVIVSWTPKGITTSDEGHCMILGGGLRRCKARTISGRRLSCSGIRHSSEWSPERKSGECRFRTLIMRANAAAPVRARTGC